FFSPASGGAGTYTFDVSLPNDQNQSACFTYPVTYICKANAGQGDQPSFIRATGTGGQHQVHLRASSFGGSCQFQGEDSNCNSVNCTQCVNQDVNLRVCK